MDPQSNYVPNQPPVNMAPATVTAPKPKKSGKKVLVFLAVVVGLALVAGLAYTNVLLTKSNNKISKLNTDVSKLSGLSGQLDQVVKTGANDKILGIDKIDKNGYQSVFLNGGQVYFGKITEIGTQNIILEDVYYLKAGQDVNAKDQSLVKLGCELHKPEDKMTIIRSNVIFWENLKDNDKAGVVSAIQTYKKANPNGQKCET